MSILLACIADKLGPNGECGTWNQRLIREQYLTNPRHPNELRKLRLQDGDEEEYQRGLEGEPSGSGSVAQAWKTMQRLVEREGVADLLDGLDRLRVVSICLDTKEDPQQIFESLNATGLPLTESEKVKSWLLMKLPDDKQQRLHDECWREIERQLGAKHTTEPIDMFLRDFLRWKTGVLHNEKCVYEVLRRWAIVQKLDKENLFHDLVDLARLYGMITGTAGDHHDPKVARELRHLRDLGIGVHRPLTLRLLNDSTKNVGTERRDKDLVKILEGISAWITRMWLAERPLAGINKAATSLAHRAGPSADDDVAEYWLERIKRLQNSRAEVPSDEAVRRGILERKAYGGNTNASTSAVLYAMIKADHQEEAPPHEDLSIEHVMPQKLTNAWKQYLGSKAEELHGQYCDRLANLTLIGGATNARLGANTFAKKKRVFRNSPIQITKLIADEPRWNRKALERRAEYLAGRALKCWPWEDAGISEFEVNEDNQAQSLWAIVEGLGGIPGQPEKWQSPDLYTEGLNEKNDHIRIYVGNPERLWLFGRADEYPVSDKGAARMLAYSRKIQEHMSDQDLDGNDQKESNAGRTIKVCRDWISGDDDEWPEIAQWIIDQVERLSLILAEPLDEES